MDEKEQDDKFPDDRWHIPRVSKEDAERRNPKPGVWDFSNFYERKTEKPDDKLVESFRRITLGESADRRQKPEASEKTKEGAAVKIGKIQYNLGSDILDTDPGAGDFIPVKDSKNFPDVLRDGYLLIKQGMENVYKDCKLAEIGEKTFYIKNGVLIIEDGATGITKEIGIEKMLLRETKAASNSNSKDIKEFSTLAYIDPEDSKKAVYQIREGDEKVVSAGILLQKKDGTIENKIIDI
jgi:hypothetical protein